MNRPVCLCGGVLMKSSLNDSDLIRGTSCRKGCHKNMFSNKEKVRTPQLLIANLTHIGGNRNHMPVSNIIVWGECPSIYFPLWDLEGFLASAGFFKIPHIFSMRLRSSLWFVAGFFIFLCSASSWWINWSLLGHCHVAYSSSAYTWIYRQSHIFPNHPLTQEIVPFSKSGDLNKSCTNKTSTNPDNSTSMLHKCYEVILLGNLSWVHDQFCSSVQ